MTPTCTAVSAGTAPPVPAPTATHAALPAARCSAEDQCCTSYEHCISCCLAPDNGAKEAMQTARGFRAPYKCAQLRRQAAGRRRDLQPWGWAL